MTMQLKKSHDPQEDYPWNDLTGGGPSIYN